MVQFTGLIPVRNQDKSHWFYCAGCTGQSGRREFNRYRSLSESITHILSPWLLWDLQICIFRTKVARQGWLSTVLSQNPNGTAHGCASWHLPFSSRNKLTSNSILCFTPCHKTPKPLAHSILLLSTYIWDCKLRGRELIKCNWILGGQYLS